MLNFESFGSPVDKIMDKTTKKEQIVYLSDPELDGEVRNGYTNIKLESHQSFQQIPDNKERNILYVTGASGSGKSYYSVEYIHQYIKKHPKNDVFLFSSVGEDNVLDKIKKLKWFKIHDEDFVGKTFTVDDFKDCLLIFDDVDCISSKPILKKVYEILDKVLTTGRHTGRQSSGATTGAGLDALGDAKAACILDNLFKICSCLDQVHPVVGVLSSSLM
jgi:Cdc6-like AAA superfamily ATPase